MVAVSAAALAPVARAARLTPAPRRVDVVIEARMGHFTPRVIRVHRGDTVHVTLRAVEGAHGFRVQGADSEVTAYPGVPAEISFVASWEGGREWYCTFNCGPQHGAMTGMIVVEDDRK